MIKKQDILSPTTGENMMKDMIGNPIVKVREGSLHLNNLLTFTHAAENYELTPLNQFKKKED